MNLEGTKHEKVVLIVITYIIGFTTGFIAFGAPAWMQKDTSAAAVVSPMSDYVPPTENPPSDVVPPEPMEAAYYEEGKLYATVGADRFVLSLHNDVMPDDNVEGFSTQGIHQNLPAYLISPDERFVYFCEQQTAEPECVHFVFDRENSLIQFVANDGEKVVTPNSVAELASWGQDGRLMIGELSSADASTPWILSSSMQADATTADAEVMVTPVE